MLAVRKHPQKLLLFIVAMALAHLTVAASPAATQQALLWIPSGVAVSGCLLLGAPAMAVIFAITIIGRLLHSYDFLPTIPAALGSCAEGMLGAALLRWLRIDAHAERPRDLVRIAITAAIAPIGSLLFSAIARAIFSPDMSVVADWSGWWRMNALGILLIVPFALAWTDPRTPPGKSPPRRSSLLMGGLATATVTVVALTVSASLSVIVMLTSTLLICFLAAIYYGTRTATATAVVSVLAIVVPASFGYGPLQQIAIANRQEVAQLIVATLAALPILFSVVLAERDSNAERWIASGGFGRALLRVLPDASYRISEEGVIQDAAIPANSRLRQASELIGKNIRDVVTASLCARILERLAKARSGEHVEPLEFELQTPRGGAHREMRFVTVPNGDTLAVTRDITMRKRAQQQLTLQAEILEMVATAQRRSDVFAAIVKGVEAQIPGSRCSVLLLQGDRLRIGNCSSLPESYNAAVDGFQIGPVACGCGTAAYRNETVIIEDMETSPLTVGYRDAFREHGLMACWSVPVRSTPGTVLGTFAVYPSEARPPEPSELGLIERAAVLAGLTLDRERREGLLASVQQNINEGLYRSVPGEGYAYVNEAFAQLFGYDSADEFSRCWREADNAQHRDCLERLLNETLTARHRELRLHRRDGEAFWALTSTSVQFHDDDAELICDGSITDVTQRRQLEDQLRQAQKMEAVGQLAGGVAHDFNNLLTAITGFAEGVRDELPPGGTLRNDVDQILEAGKRATTLTRQLLAFGRRQVLAPEVIDITSVVTEIGDMLRRLIGNHIELEHDARESSVRTKVDRGQFEQVIVNLVINARDAMPNGGRIQITTDAVQHTAGDDVPHAELAPGRYAVLRVADQGAGMAPEVASRAFDPFFTTKEPGRGTGLGLSTVYGIVKQSHGTVTIDSIPDQGTALTVYLPFAEEMPRNEPTVVIKRPDRRGATILVVEDETFVLELAARALQQAGHHVLRATDGANALELFVEHQEEIDAVVSDVVMPHMSGAELGRKLLAIKRDLRILYMSGYTEDIIEFDGDTHAHFLHKPFTSRQLVEQVDTLLGCAGPPAVDPNREARAES